MSLVASFEENPQQPLVNFCVWLNQAAKERACIRMAEADANLVFLAWSRLTYWDFQKVIDKHGIPNEVVLAHTVLPFQLEGKNFVFLDRHFDLKKETAFLEPLNVQEVVVHIALDDPILARFKADRIQKVMEDLAHPPDEPIQHKMIDSSIMRALRKVMDGELPEDCPDVLKEWLDGID